MTTDERITLDPAILAGKPIVRGTRLSVELIIGLMADGWREADILTNYPGLAHEDITACLAYARDVLQSETVHPLGPSGEHQSPAVQGQYRVGEYRVDYTMPSQEELQAAHRELEELFENSKTISENK